MKQENYVTKSYSVNYYTLVIGSVVSNTHGRYLYVVNVYLNNAVYN